jgi:Ser/Thr protein kinase RdoA (MazF antagonist)
MATGPPSRVLDALGLRPPVTCLKDVPPGNASWLVEDRGGGRLVLRRYYAGAAPPDLAYEHAVLRHLASSGWLVPEPIGEVVEDAGLWYCPTRYVPGSPASAQTAAQQRRHGRDAARLHLALRGLGPLIGQRPGWRALHDGPTAHTGIDWRACIRQLAPASPWLAAWAQAAAAHARDALADAGGGDLPVTVVHGDLAWWNVHYVRGRLSGVIDFGLTHLDSRPAELAAGRLSRSREALQGYRAELAHLGWPLSELEQAAILPVADAFDVDLLAWHLDQAGKTGNYDLAFIERRLTATRTPPP